MQAIPAERVVRHRYNPRTRQFYKDETIVKIEKEPFTHGAMRHCYRMKKLATPPQSASNHRFHSYGWSRALNYVAKCYLNEDGTIDTSQHGSDSVLTDIILQYEAAHWAEEFNKSDPPKKVDFIRAYALEFVDRPGKPMFAVERFIAGNDSYGVGFLKHNTNSGYVDTEIRRKTPQVFSAHSFYASEGQRLVADIQGVGDLYTDPQVLSIDFRFGDGDLGPRGMALFFKTFRHCDLSDMMGIPIFPLSRNERRHQAKYDDEESTLSESSSILEDELLCRFKMLDLNRERRKTALMRPVDIESDHSVDTARRSNLSRVSLTIQKSVKLSKMQKSSRTVVQRSKSDVDEVASCLNMALTDTVFDHRSFHRYESGELKPRHLHGSSGNRSMRRTNAANHSKIIPESPMKITDKTKANLGKVHYYLACLHGMDRFPEIVPALEYKSAEEAPSHDIFSVIFHLCHAASLYNVQACLSLARARVGLDSSVSPLLQSNIPIDFESSKDLCRRALSSQCSAAAPKVAAGCLLYQILEDEGGTGDVEKISVLEESLDCLKVAAVEAKVLKEHAQKQTRGKAAGFHVGDKVEGNYFMEGTFYPGVVVQIVSDDCNEVVIKYDDDGSTEKLTVDNVRSLEPATQMQGVSPISDADALGAVNTDEESLFQNYELMAKLAELKAKIGDASSASKLFQDAAELAMSAGKLQSASNWSVRAAELEG
mmetsp:Transcript_29919/g.62954  ORF Transcript_29919/g.62954 Transcript_29919/m.62954 type:complete len:711 (+) Transcript_29919:444-2576(+)